MLASWAAASSSSAVSTTRPALADGGRGCDRLLAGVMAARVEAVAAISVRGEPSPTLLAPAFRGVFLTGDLAGAATVALALALALAAALLADLFFFAADFEEDDVVVEVEFSASFPPPSTLRLSVAFHLFLMALSGRPTRRLAMAAHLFPSSLCASMMIWSSSSVHGSFDIDGSRWLCHRSRHCFPTRPSSCPAISLFHRRGPYFSTIAIMIASSCVVVVSWLPI